MKQSYHRIWDGAEQVAPHAGAWIETCCNRARCRVLAVAPHAGAWIETLEGIFHSLAFYRRPPRGGVD